MIVWRRERWEKDWATTYHRLILDAANRLNGKRARRKIIAYVEAYDDIFFWRTVLSGFENEERYFEVMLPSRLNLTKGKRSVLMTSFHRTLVRIWLLALMLIMTIYCKELPHFPTKWTTTHTFSIPMLTPLKTYNATDRAYMMWQ